MAATLAFLILISGRFPHFRTLQKTKKQSIHQDSTITANPASDGIQQWPNHPCSVKRFLPSPLGGQPK
jgi:hypothetical protein